MTSKIDKQTSRPMIGFKYNASKKIQGLLGINYFNYQNIIDNNNDNFEHLPNLQHHHG